jgi:hypothetical protein
LLHHRILSGSCVALQDRVEGSEVRAMYLAMRTRHRRANWQRRSRNRLTRQHRRLVGDANAIEMRNPGSKLSEAALANFARTPRDRDGRAVGFPSFHVSGMVHHHLGFRSCHARWGE